jgi:hypothetical protein
MIIYTYKNNMKYYSNGTRKIYETPKQINDDEAIKFIIKFGAVYVVKNKVISQKIIDMIAKNEFDDDSEEMDMTYDNIYFFQKVLKMID